MKVTLILTALLMLCCAAARGAERHRRMVQGKERPTAFPHGGNREHEGQPGGDEEGEELTEDQVTGENHLLHFGLNIEHNGSVNFHATLDSFHMGPQDHPEQMKHLLNITQTLIRLFHPNGAAMLPTTTVKPATTTKTTTKKKGGSAKKKTSTKKPTTKPATTTTTVAAVPIVEDEGEEAGSGDDSPIIDNNSSARQARAAARRRRSATKKDPTGGVAFHYMLGCHQHTHPELAGYFTETDTRRINGKPIFQEFDAQVHDTYDDDDVYDTNYEPIVHWSNSTSSETSYEESPKDWVPDNHDERNEVLHKELWGLQANGCRDLLLQIVTREKTMGKENTRSLSVAWEVHIHTKTRALSLELACRASGFRLHSLTDVGWYTEGMQLATTQWSRMEVPEHLRTFHGQEWLVMTLDRSHIPEVMVQLGPFCRYHDHVTNTTLKATAALFYQGHLVTRDLLVQDHQRHEVNTQDPPELLREPVVDHRSELQVLAGVGIVVAVLILVVVVYKAVGWCRRSDPLLPQLSARVQQLRMQGRSDYVEMVVGQTTPIPPTVEAMTMFIDKDDDSIAESGV